LSHKIAWNTVVQILGKVASTSLGLLIVVILTRSLGRENYGVLTFASVFVTMFGTLADWGITLITVREASRGGNQAKEIIGNVLVIRLILAAVAAVAAVAAIHLLPYSPMIRFLVALNSLVLIALSIKTSFQIIFNVKLAMHNWAISEFSANALTIFLILFLVKTGLSLEGIVVAYLAGDVLAAVVAAFLGYRLLPLRYSLVAKTTKFLLLESLPMGAILVVFTIYNRIDTVILSLFKGNGAVGLYGIAYRVYEVLVLGAAYFANAVLPLISRLAKDDHKRLGEVYRRCFVVLLLMGLAVAIGNLLLAPLAVMILGGNDFVEAVVPLRILSLALLVSYFNHINGYTLIALGRQWQSFFIAIAALSVNVGLNLWLIPYFSYNGAAAVTFVTEGMILVFSLVIIKREVGVLPAFSDIPLVLKELISKHGKIFEN